MDRTRSGGHSSISRYLNDIRALRLLTVEEESGMPVRAHADLVTSNLGFVVKVASDYKNMGLPFEDLLNEGNIGLIEAARHFDPSRGTKFITYAIWWIRKSILKLLSQQSAMVRVPAYQLRKLRNVRNTGRKLSRELGRVPEREEISKELGVPIAAIDEILLTKKQELSLDDAVERDTGTPILDRLADVRSANPEQELIRREDRVLVYGLLRNLGEEDQTVLINHYGLGGGPSFALSEIGEKLGLSRERVRQIKERAQQSLRGLIQRAPAIN